MRGGASKDGCGEGVGMAVQSDDPPFGRRRRGEIGLCFLDPVFLGVSWRLVLFWFLRLFFHGRSPMARLRVEATGAGGRSVWSRTEGCSQAFGVLRPTMVLSAKAQSRNGGVTSVQSSSLWTFGHPCVLQHSRVPRGTLNQTLRSAQRRLLNDYMPSRMHTDGVDLFPEWFR